MAKYAVYMCGLPEDESTYKADGEDCPNFAEHTPSPNGYLQWHEWAETMSKTHSQVLCTGCDRYRIWVPKKPRKRKEKVDA